MNLTRFNRNMMPTMGRNQQRHSGYGDDELSCKICLGLYSDRSTGQRPRTLPCRHTFCESCLQQLFKPRPNERFHQRKQVTSGCRLYCEIRLEDQIPVSFALTHYPPLSFMPITI